MVDEVVIAYHEAGHAVLAERLGGRVLAVTIIPLEDDGPRRHGQTTIAWRTPNSRKSHKELVLAQAQVALAGPVAEMIYCDSQYEIEVIQEWWADWVLATGCLRELDAKISESDSISLLGEMMRDLIQWMSRDDVWHCVATVADELEAHETLEADQLEDLRSIGVLAAR
jgi:ATP-dependent Zn protease